MLKLSSKGGERVKGGTYWSYDSGERITIENNGVLPGKSSQSYVKFPPAAVPTLGLILIGIVPPYLKDLYSAYAEQLMNAYVAAGFAFLITVVGVLSIMVLRDLVSPTHTTKTFRFSPDVAASETDELARVNVTGRRVERE
jgi:hypothetical protein